MFFRNTILRNANESSTKYLRVCLFCLESYNGKIWHADACRPYAGRAGLYVYRGRRYENSDIFQKCVQIGPDFCCGDLRSVGATASSRPVPAG